MSAREAEALIEEELAPEPEEGQEVPEAASPTEAAGAEARRGRAPIEQELAPEPEEVQEEPEAASPSEATAAEESQEQA